MRVNPRKGRDPRPLHLKLRVRITRPMGQAEMLALVQRAIATGVVPPGIVIRWIDWEKGEEGKANSGTLPGPVLGELRVWYGLMNKAALRVAVVKGEKP